MKLGILGGAFNPVHIGHLIVAESVREQLKLDNVFFVPAGDPPHRTDVDRATAAARMEMAKLAVEGNTSFEASDIELKRPGRSYTIDTVSTFAAMYPRDEICLLIGSDNLAEFHTWKSPKEILAKCELIVFSRAGFPAPDAGNEYARVARRVAVPHMDISGSEIRRRVKMGRSIRYMVPKSVEEYIVHHGLYRD